ncbi:sorting nexin-11 [Centropristis striata]|uniref:sorting nexin-11 n=1 Tax=Centropristis striata TaxID=184440 RepID=UPI0027E0B59A|nr:sorting nexin-11 [Centropristis striata]
MISNQEEDEFVAVRVQDPRLQNEGSWNSYVDYKIFLHTNSKAFTAKTSCVRRRYSEFVWLKKKLQKNSGLVPVPDLPGKCFFSFSNEDFLEKRRKGLQTFLDSVVNMTVCLSDSQLHLFLQTQLPVGHIEDCVQGHTPYSVTDAILTYASSNRGFAQAQEDDVIKEPSLTVSYESMESPAPHLPVLQSQESFSPELLTCADPDPLEGLLELCDKDTEEFQYKDKSSIRVLQKNNHLEAVVEDSGPREATFFLGDVPESLSLTDEQQRSCQIQAAVEVHSPMGTGFEEKCGVDRLFQECSEREESDLRSQTEEKTVQLESSVEAKMEKVDSEQQKCANSAAILDLKESEAGSQEEVLEVVCSEMQVVENQVGCLKHETEEKTVSDSDTERKVGPCESSEEVQIEKVDSEPEKCVNLKEGDFQEQVTESVEVLEVVCSEKQDLENHVIPEVHDLEHDTEESSVPSPDTEEKEDQSESFGEVKKEKIDLEPEKSVNSAETSHIKDSEMKEQVAESDSKSQEVLEVVCSEKPVLENHVISEVKGLERVDSTEAEDVGCLDESESKEESSCEDVVQRMDQVEQDQDLVRTKDDSDDESSSSSNESIVKVSDEESACEEEEEEEEEVNQAANGYIQTEEDITHCSTRNILDLHMNVCPVDKEDMSVQEDDDLHYITNISDLSNSLDLNSAVTGGDLTENSDISILEM